MVTLIEREQPRNRIFALAMSHPVTVDRMRQQMENAIRAYQPSLEQTNGFEFSLDLSLPKSRPWWDPTWRALPSIKVIGAMTRISI